MARNDTEAVGDGVGECSEFVRIDISREMVAPENSLQARQGCTKICRYIFMMSAVMT